MQNLNFNVGSRIKIIDKKSEFFRYRGTIKVMPNKDENTNQFVSNECICHLTKTPDKNNANLEVKFNFSQIDTIQKKFIDIEHLREDDVDLGNGIIRRSNSLGFDLGDDIQITEKCDGANASIAWNEDENKLEIFSRTNLLDGVDGLRGFKTYVETKFKPDEFKMFPDLVIFGEWCVSHRCQYEKSWYNVWRVYDIWSKSEKRYMPQGFVKKFCAMHGIEYIHVLYEGPFVSWNHCRSFMNAKTYGGLEQEGIVVKNQSKLDRDDLRFPKYLKIVNDAFKESMLHKKKKELDPEVKKEMENAKALMSNVVTEARVHKAIMKLVDEGIVPAELTPKCIGTVMKHIPAIIWSDVLKEEAETVTAAGEYAGKFCSGIVAEIAKKIVLGK